MEKAVNELTIQLLSQPLFLFFVLIGLGYFIFSVTKHITNNFKVVIGLIIFLVAILIIYQMSKSTLGIALILLSVIAIIILSIMVLIKNPLNKKNTNVNNYNQSIISNIEDNICPQCGGSLIKRNGKYGEFLGCSNYPKCKYTKNI